MTEPLPKIRVLLIAPSLSIVGGQAVQASRLLQELGREPEIEIAFQPINVALPKWLLRIPYLRTVLAFVVYTVQLLWRIPRYDVIHTFTAGLWSFALWTIPAINIGRMYGRKVIVNYRDGRAEQHLQTWRTAKPMLLRAAVVISPSDYLVDVFGRYGIPSRRIYNIIDFAAFRFRSRRNLRPVLMTNRGLEALYNVGCVLRAFALVQQRYPDASLTVAHDGPCRQELEKEARELGLKNTRFIGSVPQRQVPDLYDSADIYVMSPNIDCMPGTLLECFAAGIPAVATKAGGIPYIIDHGRTGMLVDLDDHVTMAEHVLRLIDDPNLAEQMTQSAHAELEKYAWANIRHEWLALYRELTGRASDESVTQPTVRQRAV
jgi:glycosyltransferase involved in cell wall biosynthesis